MLRNHQTDDDETWFPGSFIIVHNKDKIINLSSKLLLCTSGLNEDGRSKISSTIRLVFAFQVTYTVQGASGYSTSAHSLYMQGRVAFLIRGSTMF